MPPRTDTNAWDVSKGTSPWKRGRRGGRGRAGRGRAHRDARYGAGTWGTGGAGQTGGRDDGGRWPVLTPTRQRRRDVVNGLVTGQLLGCILITNY